MKERLKTTKKAGALPSFSDNSTRQYYVTQDKQ